MGATWAPCPFCGGKRTETVRGKYGPEQPEFRHRKLRMVDDEAGRWSVICYGCHAVGPDKETQKQAKESWNRRA